MNWRAIKAVMSKDLKVVLRSPMILLPMILLPIIMQVLLPVGISVGISLGAEAMQDEVQDIQAMMDLMPAEVLSEFEGMTEAQVILVLFLVYFFAPMYLIIPMMVSSVIAADSFVGERERKTLEALLHTPLTNNEMLFAKMLSAWGAANVVGVAAFLLYAVIVNFVGYSAMGGLFFPNAMWVILVLWVAPAAAGLGLTATVLVSSRAKTYQEASQMGGIVVVPIIGLVLAQAAGVLYLSNTIAIILGVVLWVLDAVLLWIGIRTFDRDALLARL